MTTATMPCDSCGRTVTLPAASLRRGGGHAEGAVCEDCLVGDFMFRIVPSDTLPLARTGDEPFRDPVAGAIIVPRKADETPVEHRLRAEAVVRDATQMLCLAPGKLHDPIPAHVREATRRSLFGRDDTEPAA